MYCTASPGPRWCDRESLTTKGNGRNHWLSSVQIHICTYTCVCNAWTCNADRTNGETIANRPATSIPVCIKDEWMDRKFRTIAWACLFHLFYFISPVGDAMVRFSIISFIVMYGVCKLSLDGILSSVVVDPPYWVVPGIFVTCLSYSVLRT